MSRTKEEKEALIRARRKAVIFKCLIEEAEERLAEAVEEKQKNPSDEEAQRRCFELENEIRDLTAKYNSAKIAADEYALSDSDVKELAREDATDRARFPKKDVMSDEEVIALAKM